jgi:predicted nuclease of predicted toxin-antitoxin system
VFLVDEDLPRSFARSLREGGFEAEDVRDVGLRGRSDEEVLRYAEEHNRILVTADLGFGNVFKFPRGSHRGIVIVRFPNELPARTLVSIVSRALTGLSMEELDRNLVIIEPGRIRLRPRR